MDAMRHEDISGWAGRIDTIIANTPDCCVRRAVVVESTPCTMDAALSFARGRPGLLLVASRQTHGRGSHGRPWHDGDGCTLPCTFVIDPGAKDAPMLAACVACALHEALSALTPPPLKPLIKWPNDIIIRDEGGERKLAGTLIEQKMGLALIGIGINCAPTGVRRSVSLWELGASVTRLDLACRLVEHISQWFAACDRGAIRSYYSLHDAMVGTPRSFLHDNAFRRGIVEHIDPLSGITIETGAGRHTLPIAQTTHVRAEASVQGPEGC